MFANRRGVHDTKIHLLVCPSLDQQHLASPAFLGGRAEEDDLPVDVVLFHGDFDSERNPDSASCDQVVAARVSDTRERVHLRIYTQNTTAFPVRELGAPCRIEVRIVRRNVKAMFAHEIGQLVVRIPSFKLLVRVCAKFILVWNITSLRTLILGDLEDANHQIEALKGRRL